MVIMFAEPAERWRPTLVVYDPLKAGSIDGTDTIPHDRAIERAILAKYKANSELRSDPESTIFVGRLDRNTTETDLSDYFKKFGEIVSTHLVRDIVTGFSKCYAFIEFAEKRDARDAQRANGARIDDREILVEMECGRTMKGWKPRRLGGGFTGKKESGQLRFGGNQKPFKRPYNLYQNRSNEEFGTPFAASSPKVGGYNTNAATIPRSPRTEFPRPPPPIFSSPAPPRERSFQRDDNRRPRDYLSESRRESRDRSQPRTSDNYNNRPRDFDRSRDSGRPTDRRSREGSYSSSRDREWR